MATEVDRGELLKGHDGQYRFFDHPEGRALSEAEKSEFLMCSEPGDGAEENQLWRCKLMEGRMTIVSGYAAPRLHKAPPTIYQHLRYWDCTPANLRELAQKSICRSFATEDDLDRVIAGGAFPAAEDLLVDKDPIPGEGLAKLAGCCLFNAVQNYMGKLVILVPEDRDYLSYCRGVAVQLLGCLPYGLRRHLSFAFNSRDNETARKKFTVLFARDNGQEGVRLDRLQEFEGLEDTLSPGLTRLIEAIVSDEALVERIYRELESSASLEQLSWQVYESYQTERELNDAPMDLEALGKYAGMIKKAGIPEWKRRITERVAKRLKETGGIGALLKDAPEFQTVRSFAELAKAAGAYEELLAGLDVTLDGAFSEQLLKGCWSSGRGLDAALQAKEDLSGQEACLAKVLDHKALSACHDQIEESIRKENEAFSKDFCGDRKLSDLLNALATAWDTEASEKLEQLSRCNDQTRKKCLDALARKAEERFEDGSLENVEANTLYDALKGVLAEPAQQKRLNDGYQKWQENMDKRRERMDKMQSFAAWFKLGEEMKPDQLESYEDKLWEYFEKRHRDRAGVKEFLQAFEQHAGHSWAENTPSYVSETLRRFVGKRQMGIWLDSGKTVGDLYSEALAYQFLIGSGDKNFKNANVCLWYRDKGKDVHAECGLNKLLRALKDALQDRQESSGLTGMDVLERAGCLDEDKKKFFVGETQGRSGRTGRHDRGRNRTPLLWILAIGALATLMIVAVLVLTLGGKDEGEMPSDEPSAPGTEEVVFPSGLQGLSGILPSSKPDAEPSEVRPSSKPDAAPSEVRPSIKPDAAPSATPPRQSAGRTTPDPVGSGRRESKTLPGGSVTPQPAHTPLPGRD